MGRQAKYEVKALRAESFKDEIITTLPATCMISFLEMKEVQVSSVRTNGPYMATY